MSADDTDDTSADTRNANLEQGRQGKRVRMVPVLRPRCVGAVSQRIHRGIPWTIR
jgi:hypothetical protein